MSNDNKEPESVVGIDEKLYKKIKKSCLKKGHGFSYDKYNNRRLIKIYGDELHEVVDGEKGRRVISLTDEMMTQNTPLNPFAYALKELVSQGMSQQEAWKTVMAFYHDDD